MLLEAMNMDEFHDKVKKCKSVIIPFGSVEEHGPHLPLGTDTLHAYELAKSTATYVDVFVCPPIWYGLCKSTSQHPGTVSVSGLTLLRLAVEIVGSLYGQGLRNFIILSGHAGSTHMAYLIDAGEQILSEYEESRVAVLSIIDVVAGCCKDLVETEGDSHAGEVETSLMLHLRPEWVKGSAEREFPSFPKHVLVRDKRPFWPNGVWGDPAKATVEKGKAILDREGRYLADLIKKIEKMEKGF